MSRPLLAIVAVIVAVGCSGGSGSSGYKPTPAPKIEPASVKAGQEQQLFPFEVGNSWTFSTKTVQKVKTQTRQKTTDATFKVTKVDVNGDTKRATVDLIVENEVVDRQVWTSSPKGIYQVSIGLKTPRVFTTPIPAIVFPVEPDKKFAWKGSDGKSQMGYNSVIRGPQEVDTDEKRMSAIAVESKGTSVTGKITEKTDRTIWFAPGVGIVRIREFSSSSVGASELLLSLKSHTVK